jgi:hypothetical protein
VDNVYDNFAKAGQMGQATFLLTHLHGLVSSKKP